MPGLCKGFFCSPRSPWPCQEFDLPLQYDVCLVVGKHKTTSRSCDVSYIPLIPAHLSFVHLSFASSRIATPLLLPESLISPTSDKSQCRADRAQCLVRTNRAMPHQAMMAQRSRRCYSQQTLGISV